MRRDYIRSLMIGVAWCGLIGSASAATGNSTIITGSNYQANSTYAQGAGANPKTGSYAPETPTEVITNDPGATTVIPSAGNDTISSSGNAEGPNVRKAFKPMVANAAPMPAQTSSNGVISNAQTIGSCLCLENSYKTLNSQVTEKQNAYNAAVQQRAALDQQLATAKGGPASPDQVAMIRQVSEKRIGLQGQINDRYIPDLQSTTSQYNAAVAQYQQSCAGKSFDVDVTARIQSTLQCQGG